MTKKLTVIPELCCGCRVCELACAKKHFGINNPKKSAVRVLIAYPHPVIRMPIICSQCRVAPCAEVCPVGALTRTNNVVKLDKDTCISCLKCIEACPFGAMYAHEDIDYPIKCDTCDGDPECVKVCPKQAIRFISEDVLGESQRMNNILSYTQMKEIEFHEKGEKKIIHYAEIGKEKL